MNGTPLHMSDFLLIKDSNENRLYDVSTEAKKREVYAHLIVNSGLDLEHLEWLLTTKVREPVKPMVPFDATSAEIEIAQSAYEAAQRCNLELEETNRLVSKFLGGDTTVVTTTWLETTLHKVLKNAKVEVEFLTLTELN